MRKAWTNLILKVTVLINNKKQELLTSHAFLAIFNVFLIIFLELFLFLISLPLYLVSKEIDAGTQVQYQIRRVLSLTVLSGILVIWLVKLIFMIGIPLYYDTQQAYFVSRIDSGALLSQIYLTPEAYSSPTSEYVQSPRINDVERLESGAITISGAGQPRTEIIAMVGGEQFEGTKFYVDSVNPLGDWTVTTEGGNLRLLPGEYWLQIMSYDTELQTKSELSPAYSFEIASSWYSDITNVAGTYLNYIVLAFLIIGIFSIILLI